MKTNICSISIIVRRQTRYKLILKALIMAFILLCDDNVDKTGV